jgi:hypothetical protein
MKNVLDSTLVEEALRSRGLWENMVALPGRFGLIVIGDKEFFYRQHGFEDENRNLMAWSTSEPGDEEEVRLRVADLRYMWSLCGERTIGDDMCAYHTDHN